MPLIYSSLLILGALACLKWPIVKKLIVYLDTL
jgi:hypothetical protein